MLKHNLLIQIKVFETVPLTGDAHCEMGAVPRYLLRTAGHRPSVVVGTFTALGASWNVVRPIADSYFRVESGSGSAGHRVQDTGTALVEVGTISRFLERGRAKWFAVGTGALRVYKYEQKFSMFGV